MCPIKKEMSFEPDSTCSSPSSEQPRTVWTSPPKRPAGRTKFRETRHPVFRGIRRRGGAGRWVCEVRVPGRRGCRLWLGTFDAAESAARAHDAAMLALDGGAGACLNFADSARLLAVPRANSRATLADVRRAVAEAVEDFQRRREAPSSSSSSSSSSIADDGEEDATESDDSSPAAFELDVFGDMSGDMYYASLGQGMLMEPPPSLATPFADDNVVELPLWSY